MQTHPDKTIVRPLLRPTRPLPSAPAHPSSQPLIDVRVELIELSFGIPRPKVVAPPPKHGIQFGDDLLHILPALSRIGQLMHAFPDSLHRLGRRPPLRVIPPRIPLYAPLLSNRAAQKYKAPLPPAQVHHPRFLRVQHQSQLVHHKLDLSKSLLRL